MSAHDPIPAEVGDLLAELRIRVHELPMDAARAQEFLDLAGESGDEYRSAQREIEKTIAELRSAAREIKRLRAHAHVWNYDGFCSECGADGAA